MKKLALSFWGLFLGFGASAAEPAFPDVQQRQALADTLLKGMESIDALSIYVRDQTRDVKWNQYRAHATEQIAQAENWNALYFAIGSLHFGIVNQHSFLQVGDWIKEQVTPVPRWPEVNIGYTWPKLSFFNQQDGKDIKLLNGVDITKLFSDYHNYFCRSAHEIGCLESFVTDMERGYRFNLSEPSLEIAYHDGTKLTLASGADKNRTISTSNAPTCEGLYEGLSFQQRYVSEQACLYETDDAFVLKILFFGNWGTEQDDIYCSAEQATGMCGAIHGVRDIINSKPAKKLVVDLQNNPGGSENTPWVAAFGKPFKDNLVRYRNVEPLQNQATRVSAFYGSEFAEDWYQLLSDEDKKQTYLPLRADFCRGSALCQSKDVAPATSAIQYQRLAIVTNPQCVSSCDDLVWRLKAYAGAKVFGQLPATDGTYARLDGYLLLNADGQFSTVIKGEGENVDFGADILVAQYRLPISRTVNLTGVVLEGNSDVLDFPLAVEKQSFSTRTHQNLLNTLSQL
ncbi:S41 family peptidase [Bowmanella pacifica]|uniref:Tail specific protease domain-containing protein n=1 Tax=Bowmanella pacifica TaxID=502051 RepID=A0A917YXQ0_9ALTE|nr:S41 family peptidase [Bowmanella pacifica]GGO67145.1 hypothetical protein GCM10010982_12910 [Bowmanella pacifica]